MASVEQWLARYEEGTVSVSELFGALLQAVPASSVDTIIGRVPEALRRDFVAWLSCLSETSRSLTSNGFVNYPPEALKAVVAWQRR